MLRLAAKRGMDGSSASPATAGATRYLAFDDPVHGFAIALT